jgi:hydroxymethylglutaryl-CoA synthase
VPVAYGKFLSWRGMLTPEPPRRPAPSRVSAPAAARSEAWKFAFVGSRHRGTGAVHLPPARVPMGGGAPDEMDPVPMADAEGTVVTFTVDTMVHSPDPPVVFAVVDFAGGGRFPVELTDVAPDDVAIGTTVDLVFRRLSSADGIHDYFWKGRPRRPGASDPAGTPSGSAGSARSAATR